MNHLGPKIVGLSLVLIAGMATVGLAGAQGGHDDATPAPKAEAALPAKTEEQLPATADGVWQAIDLKTAELGKTIQRGSLREVHHLAYAVRDLVAALPERSKSLPAEKQAKVQSGVKFVSTLADRLDASGDAGDKAAAQANYEKLMNVLDGLRANYLGDKAKK
jgi:hypothetical protein